MQRLAALAFAALAFLPFRTAAEPARVPLDALVAAVAAWAASETGLPLSERMPSVVFSSREAMTALHLGPGARSGEADIVAVYDTRAARIHLPEGWTGASATEASILVHEVVHHLQTASGARFACPAEREKAAYAAQERWLGLFGGGLERDFGIDRFTVFALTTCGI